MASDLHAELLGKGHSSDGEALCKVAVWRTPRGRFVADVVLWARDDNGEPDEWDYVGIGAPEGAADLEELGQLLDLRVAREHGRTSRERAVRVAVASAMAEAG